MKKNEVVQTPRSGSSGVLPDVNDKDHHEIYNYTTCLGRGGKHGAARRHQARARANLIV